LVIKELQLRTLELYSFQLIRDTVSHSVNIGLVHFMYYIEYMYRRQPVVHFRMWSTYCNNSVSRCLIL